MSVVKFTPIGVTFETIETLFREEHGADAVALYMAYCAVAAHQQTHQVWATDSFMKKKTRFGDARFRRAKALLVEKCLLETHRTDDSLKLKENGRFDKMLVRVNHVVDSLVSVGAENPTNGKTDRTENHPQMLSTRKKMLSKEEEMLSRARETTKPPFPPPTSIAYLDDLSPSEAKKIAADLNVHAADVARAATHAADYARQVGSRRYKDFRAFLRNWLRREIKAGTLRTVPPESEGDRYMDRVLRAMGGER